MTPSHVADGSPALDRGESFLWTILRRFEALALAQYAASVPDLVTPEKRELVARLGARRLSDDAFSETLVAAPLETLVACATSASAAHVLVVQGLLLEALGTTIYATFRENAAASETTHELCAFGTTSSELTRARVPELVRRTIGTGDVLLQSFMNEATPALGCLDSLGEGIDELFAERFGVGFADLMGDVAAELIATVIDLGVDRRKFVSYLTGALMGI